MSSVESLPPSYQLAPRPRAVRAECGCCHAIRDIETTHHVLGDICVWCARSFDHRLDRFGRTINDADLCPFCLETGEPCAEHR